MPKLSTVMKLPV